MKKIILLFAVGYLLLAFPAGVFAQAATLSLEPSTGTFNKGCNFSIKVNLDTGGAQTDGADAILLYDNSKFDAGSIVNGTIFPDFPGNNINTQTGRIAILGLASPSTPFSGRGTLATINFIVKDTAQVGATQVTFDFDPNNKANTTDSNVVERTTIADILNSVTNGTYTIGTGTCTQASPAPSGQGGPDASSSAKATPVATKAPVPTPTGLPDGGTFGVTSVIAIVGGFLTVVGILGLALL